MSRPQPRTLILVVVIAALVVLVSAIAIRTTYPTSPQSAPPATEAPASGGPLDDGGQVADATPPAPSPTPTIDPVIAWADSVCAASFDIRDTITAAGTDLAVTPGPGALDEIRSRLAQRGDAIIGQLEPLTVALGQVPINVPEALRLADTLGTQLSTLRTSADRTRAAIDTLSAADSVLAFGQGLPEAVASVGDSAKAAQALARTISEAASDQGGRLGPGFRDSVTCQALIAGQPG